MKKNQSLRQIPLLGIFLVATGLLLLLKQLGIVWIDSGTLFWSACTVIGAWMVIRNMIASRRGKVFIGSVLFYFGVTFLATHLSLITSHHTVLIPAFLIAFGLSFTSLYIMNPRDFHLLIPTLVFAGFGTGIVLIELDMMYFSDFLNISAQYWPLLIVLLGLSFLFRSRKN